MPYHYLESGLDNIYLENGFREVETPYGKGIAIQDTKGLHAAIARCIVETPCPLSGAELRFLRLEMEMTQRNLGAFLGVEEQRLRRWEKARKKPVEGSADRLVRGLYSDYAFGDGTLRKMVERLVELDCVDRPTLRLRERDDHWEAHAA